MDSTTTQPQAVLAVPAELASEMGLLGERFPGIVENIRRQWGSAALQDYFGRTIFDERGGRQGFPEPVVRALVRLHENHSKLFPQQATDPFWDGMSH